MLASVIASEGPNLKVSHLMGLTNKNYFLLVLLSRKSIVLCTIASIF